jgi:hypothetical protein
MTHRLSQTNEQAVPVLEAVDADEPALALEVLPVDEQPLTVLAVEPRRSWLIVRLARGITSVVEWLFGGVSLLVGLAVLAALPILGFLSLGYLLEAGGRVARSGRLRDGFIGVRLAARLGGMVLGSWVLLLPVRLVSSLARDAQIIDAGGPKAQSWRVGLLVLTALMAIHILAACARGGRLRYFLWPFNFIWLIRRICRGGYYAQARDAVWDTAMSLRLPYYFWLGFRGFVGALAWLFVPVTLLALGQARFPAAPVLGLLGAFLLAIVLFYLPFLQLRLAATNHFRAIFEVGGVRRDFARAPWAFAIAFLFTIVFALPLYLLKIEVVPRDAAWLPSLVFIAFIFPVRLLTGWALGRAQRRTTRRHWFFCWTARLPLLPIAAFYVLIVFFTQYTSWDGVLSLYEQHAFLLPIPFFGV